MKVTTQDLYCGAYILCKGGRLERTELIKGRGNRPFVSFILTGPGVEKLSEEYQSGRAIVNIASFKIAMDHLKDAIFQRTKAGNF